MLWLIISLDSFNWSNILFLKTIIKHKMYERQLTSWRWHFPKTHLITKCKLRLIFYAMKILFFIKGWGIMEEHIITFIECQMCRNSDCRFRRCSDSFRGSIFCKSISSQSQITEHLTTSQESFSASTLLSSHSISEELFVSTSTTGNYDTDQSPSANDTQQLSSNLILSYRRENCGNIFWKFYLLSSLNII